MQYVTVEGGQTVGRGSLAQQLHGQPLQPGRAFIHLHVDPGHRRRGMGSHLLERLLALAWSEGFREVAASVAPVTARLTALSDSPSHAAVLLYELDRELSADVPQWEGLMPRQGHCPRPEAHDHSLGTGPGSHQPLHPQQRGEYFHHRAEPQAGVPVAPGQHLPVKGSLREG